VEDIRAEEEDLRILLDVGGAILRQNHAGIKLVTTEIKEAFARWIESETMVQVVSKIMLEVSQ
jgi:hypothetical protein